jgi:hypothetical protein
LLISPLVVPVSDGDPLVWVSRLSARFRPFSGDLGAADALGASESLENPAQFKPAAPKAASTLPGHYY